MHRVQNTSLWLGESVVYDPTRSVHSTSSPRTARAGKGNKQNALDIKELEQISDDAKAPKDVKSTGMFYQSGRYSYEDQIDQILDRLEHERNYDLKKVILSKNGTIAATKMVHKSYSAAKNNTNVNRNNNFSISTGDRLCMSDESRERDELTKQLVMMKMRWRRIGSLWIEANFLLECEINDEKGGYRPRELELLEDSIREKKSQLEAINEGNEKKKLLIQLQQQIVEKILNANIGR